MGNEVAPPLNRDDEEVLTRDMAANVRAELARHAVASPVLVVATLLGLHRNTASARLSGTSPFFAYEAAILASHFGVPVGRLYTMNSGSFGAAEPRPLVDPA